MVPLRNRSKKKVFKYGTLKPRSKISRDLGLGSAEFVSPGLFLVSWVRQHERVSAPPPPPSPIPPAQCPFEQKHTDIYIYIYIDI